MCGVYMLSGLQHKSAASRQWNNLVQLCTCPFNYSLNFVYSCINVYPPYWPESAFLFYWILLTATWKAHSCYWHTLLRSLDLSCCDTGWFKDNKLRDGRQIYLWTVICVNLIISIYKAFMKNRYPWVIP